MLVLVLAYYGSHNFYYFHYFHWSGWTAWGHAVTLSHVTRHTGQASRVA